MLRFLAPLVLLLTACSSAPAPRSVLALEHVTIIDGTGAAPQPDMTIVIEGDRIAAVFATGSQSLDPRAERIDMSGKFVTPGLIDTHVHIGTRDRPESMNRDLLENTLMGGITSVRDMGGQGPLIKRLATQSREGRIPAPRIFYATLVTGPGSDFWLGEGPGAFVAAGGAPGQSAWFRHMSANDDPAQVAREARAFGSMGLKLHSGFTAEETSRLAAAARAEGLQVWAHAVLGPATASDLVDAGVTVLSHADMPAYEGHRGRPAAFWQRPYRERGAEARAETPTDGPVIGALLERMRERGVMLEPTLFIMAVSLANAEEDGATPAMSEHVNYAYRITRRAHASGVTIIVGTDAIGGESPNLHSELQLLVREGGLTPVEAIQAATSNAARALGQEADIGAIAPGKLADLALFARDPSADIRNTLTIEAVVLGGRLMRRTAPMPLPILAEAPP